MNLIPREPRTQGADSDRTDGTPPAQPGIVAPAGSLVHCAVPGGQVSPVAPALAPLPRPAGGPDVLTPSPAGLPAFMSSARPTHGPRVSPPDPYEDLLTGLVGPALWRRLLTTETARTARYRQSATVVVVELDGLDAFARRWGAETATNGVLAVARALLSESRASDHLARIESGRFGIILDQTGEIDAINCVERLRDACLYELRGAEDDLRLGIGWASPTPRETLADAVARAEKRLLAELRPTG